MERITYKPCNYILFCVLVMVWLLPVRVFGTENTELFEKGNTYLQQEAYDEALRVYQSFVDKNPEHRLAPAALWTMGNIYATAQNEYDNAVNCFSNIIDRNVDIEWTMYSYERMGSCYEAQEEWQNAVNVYRPAIHFLSGQNEDIAVQGSINIFRRRLLACYRNMGDHESIISVYQTALSEDPAAESAPEYQFNLAQTYQEMENLRSAAENYAFVVERYPFSPYAQRVQNEQSGLLEREIKYDWTYYTLFQSALDRGVTGEFHEAESIFNHIITTKENTPLAAAARFQEEMLDFRKTGDAAALIQTINDTRDEYPQGYGGIQVNRLIPLLEQIAESQELLAENPDDVGTHASIAYRYYVLRAYHCGIDAYNRAINIEPENKNLYNMLGYCYIGAHDFDNALVTLQQLIDIDPDDPNSYDSKAEAYYSSGDIETAIEYYEQSISIDSTFSNPYFMLGRIYAAQENNEKAIEYLEQYLLMDADGFQAQTAQQILERLRSTVPDEQ